ncbi:M24 family metallopeptidase [Arenimonas sp.]|uniref:M24 family metallopeptidase n=1 Tax=Arenimonas sp. TaxID=1872635 RepID=UPI0035B4BA43
MNRKPLGLALLLCLPAPALAAPDSPAMPRLLAPEARIEVENQILAERLETLLPRLMAETNLDMWLVLSREYAEDPVYFTLVPQPSFAARRTTLLAFHRRPDGTVERLAVNRYPLGDPFESAWAGGDLDEQWQALGQLIATRDPERIGINVSRDWAIADGLSHGLRQRLLAVLPEGCESRLVSAQDLVVRWTETRLASEREHHAAAMQAARAVIAEAFSNLVIEPGKTHTDEVAWYIRRRLEALGMPVWFHPDVNRQRAGDDCSRDSVFCGSEGVIERGDVLHTDIGGCYLKLCTDTQEMGYVLREGETDVPEGLRKALAAGNRWQDLLAANFITGRSGDEILHATHAAVEKEGLAASTYTHPLGFFGHAAGPTIGMWDAQQGGTPGSEWPLHPSTTYAIEGNVRSPVPEWGDTWVQVKLEQGGHFDGERLSFPAGRQTRWHVVR